MDKAAQTISTTGLSQKHCLVTAFESVKSLGWRIRFVSDAGVIAYTGNSGFSWNGEVTVRVEEDQLRVECVSTSAMPIDDGRNESAVRQYVGVFEKLRTVITEEEVRQKYRLYEQDFVPPYEDTLKPDIRPKFNLITSFWGFFRPAKNYFFTPVLVSLNILIFLTMVGSGISFIDPNGQSLLAWGANSTVATLNGQWWRLLTNCFLHFGIIHLALNMYALVFVGMLLEPFLGKAKFLIAYLLTGIAASVVSLWWHDYTISAGASGAIFGLYGVFLAILSTNHIERSIRNGLLSSIGMFVIYNLVYGSLKSGIDNAAHLGGLVSGLLIGYLYWPALRRPDDTRVNRLVIGGAMILILSLSAFTYIVLSRSDRVIYFKRMESFYQLEEKALKVVGQEDNKNSDALLPDLQQGISYWQEGISLINESDKLNVSSSIHSKNRQLIKYCQLRIKSYQITYYAYQNGTYPDQKQVFEINQQIKEVMNELSSR
ncbi:rhomboid family intramembrane serine protease [Mucilaginibacter sp. KACC 22063]|uniref:rhomboid family intramembrane serine protease n=1 Tax=Mucilaginibacter sp. KACC 22063 TaxID=3025666 RepID=UPI0023655670|nr:rhomboid family intramembrane serine protease [Mucilaginibacter sp. KACC 22063]WDF55613.1 rhomboid family intramembrane serine protease [Mucilaginibacter sp. KACC 22063]